MVNCFLHQALIGKMHKTQNTDRSFIIRKMSHLLTRLRNIGMKESCSLKCASFLVVPFVCETLIPFLSALSVELVFLRDFATVLEILTMFIRIYIKFSVKL